MPVVSERVAHTGDEEQVRLEADEEAPEPEKTENARLEVEVAVARGRRVPTPVKRRLEAMVASPIPIRGRTVNALIGVIP